MDTQTTLSTGLIVAACLMAGACQAQHSPPAASNVPYLNGGIGKPEAQRIEAEGSRYNLRLMFSEGNKNEFAARVHLKIADRSGRPVLTLNDAGPLTDVQLPPGLYQIDSRFGDMQRHNTVDLKDGQPVNLYLHFPHDSDTR